MRRLVALGFLLASVLDASVGRAQPLPSSSEGTVHQSRSWTWRDYRAHHQNWGVEQDARGHVFVANSSGILEYDGEEWRHHTMPLEERTMIRSLAVAPDNRVYVGGVGDFGVLEPDGLGFLNYVSLLEHVPEADREFTDVWTTHATDRGIVFQTPERLFQWDGRAMRSWTTPTRFRTAFLVEGEVIVWEEGAGLKKIGTEGIRPISGGAAFAERKVDALLAHPRGLLAAVRDEGLVLLQGGREVPLDTDGSAYLRDFRPYTAVDVPNPYADGDNLYAIATFNGGVAIIDDAGRLVRVYREDVGLSSADLNVGLHLDDQGGLWVAHLNGLTRVDLFSRLTKFDESTGLEGGVYTLVQHEGRLYAGTSNGLFRLEEGSLGRPAQSRPYAGFERVEIDGGQTWAAHSTPQGLLVGARNGIWAIGDRGAYQVSSSEAFSLVAPSGADGLALFGSKDGIGRLVVRGDRWEEVGRIDGVEGEIRSLEEDAEGGVWASELNGILAHIEAVDQSSPTIRVFGRQDGLSVSAGPLVRRGREVWMTPREGVFSISEREGRLRLDPVLSLEALSGIYGLFGTDQDGGGTLWIYEGGSFYPSGRTGTARGLELRDVNVTALLESEMGAMWIGTSDGLLRYDLRVGELETSYVASVRMVTDRDRVPLFAGHGSSSGEDLSVPYSRSRQVRFEVAAPFFDGAGEIEYQYRLDGFDDDWGAWSDERVASYTNLWPRSYTLRVRARDLHGNESDEARFVFRIVPPWYLTWWAFTLYGLGAIAVVWGIGAWRGREQNRRLDAQRARSERFQRLSARLEKTNARLRQADKLKDDLLANTSHELRTPLTAILGFSEMLLDDIDGENRSLAQGIHRGGRRLLTTVNGLLDMFKLQSGTMPVDARPVDAAESVRESVGLLQPLAASQGTDLRVIPDGLSLPSVLDPDLLDRVVTNLVSNALKFTEAGRVLVMVDGDERTLRISIQDTGIGIAADDLDRILEPFEQASTGFERTHEGTGLGLAIVQRVLSLVGGHLRFESEVGVGTTARVTLPRQWSAPEAFAGVDDQALNPSLEGVHVLGVCIDDIAMAPVRRAIGTQGTVVASGSLGRALREARTTAYDVVLLEAAGDDVERKHVRALRNVPGYGHVPILRLGGEPLSTRDLAIRGFSDQIPAPVHPDDVERVIEASLSDAEALAGVLLTV